MSLEQRLDRIEKDLRVGEDEHRAFSYTQLVRAAAHRRANPGVSLEALSELVGPPELVLRPGERSIAELVVEATRR
jgi:hypothetical protein